MPHNIKHDPVLDVIEVTFTGVLIPERDLSEVTSAAISLQKKTGTTRFLLDMNEWDGRAPLSDIYEIVDKQYWKEDLLRQSRIGVILPPSVNARQAVHFYETVCYNRGWNVKVCSDRQTAIDWLRDKSSTPDKRGNRKSDVMSIYFPAVARLFSRRPMSARTKR